MTNYERFLEKKDKLEQLYPAEYPPELIEWCNDLKDKGHHLIELEKEENENTNHFSGYSTSGYPALTIIDCVASKDGKTAKKFTEVTLNVLTLRRMTAKIMHEYTLAGCTD